MKTLISCKNNDNYSSGDFVFGAISGFATASFQIIGTFTSGTFTPQVSNNGVDWVTTVAYAADGTKKTTITADGMYRIDVNGYAQVKLTAASVVGSLRITAFASESTLHINA